MFSCACGSYLWLLLKSDSDPDSAVLHWGLQFDISSKTPKAAAAAAGLQASLLSTKILG